MKKEVRVNKHFFFEIITRMQIPMHSKTGAWEYEVP